MRGWMSEMPRHFPLRRVAGFAVVLALHAAALHGLWRHRLLPAPATATTLFARFVAPPAPEKKDDKPRRPPASTPIMPRPVAKSPPRTTTAETRPVTTADYVAPPAAPVPAPEAIGQPPPPAPAPMPLPPGPVSLSSELAVACPERPAPAYPVQSRRLGETGAVVLRVELNESGHVALARIERSSGHPRLDEAALSTVRAWRCTPPMRNGHPVRAVALQPFNFILNGN